VPPAAAAGGSGSSPLDAIEDPVLRRALQEPVAFVGGMFAGARNHDALLALAFLLLGCAGCTLAQRTTRALAQRVFAAAAAAALT
jgi:hypothetical protein